MRERTYKSGLNKTHLRVISCLGEGYTHKEIAHELGIKQNCVYFHIGNIYQIMRMNRVDQLVRLAIAFGLCSPLCLLLFAGCATKPKPTVPPIPKVAAKPLLSPKALANPPPKALLAPAAAKPRVYFIHIDYPADATNYVWCLQESADSVTWKYMTTNLITRNGSITSAMAISFRGKAGTNSYPVQMPPHTKVTSGDL